MHIKGTKNTRTFNKSDILNATIETISCARFDILSDNVFDVTKALLDDDYGIITIYNDNDNRVMTIYRVDKKVVLPAINDNIEVSNLLYILRKEGYIIC